MGGLDHAHILNLYDFDRNIFVESRNIVIFIILTRNIFI